MSLKASASGEGSAAGSVPYGTAAAEKQRQVVGETGQRRGLVAFLEAGQHFFGAPDDGIRQAGQAAHVDAVGALGGARRHLVQEHHVTLPFLDTHGMALEPGELRGQGR